MRRKDREITDLDQIVEIMRKCAICRIAFFDKEYPYIVPLNFGLQYKDNSISLFFHGATEGKKIELIKANKKVCFEMDCNHELVTADKACNYSMNYESVIGYGHVDILDADEKRSAMDALMMQYAKGMNFTYGEKELEAVTVFTLTVDSVTGKHRM